MNEDKLNRHSDTPVLPEQMPYKERLYSKIKIPLRVLDAIIWVLVAAIVVCLVVGTLKGNGML